MKVVVDEKIPYIKGEIEKIANKVIYLPGDKFSLSDIQNADALIIRTRTKCNRSLLEGSKVKFIATATIGFDHIDQEYCKEAGITWRNAPGCNASSVAQYMQSIFILLHVSKEINFKNTTLGIIGVGHVGSKIADIAQSLGMKVLKNDPPRVKKENLTDFVSLSQIMQEANIITFHVPSQKNGEYTTYHLANYDFFHSLKQHPIIINTSRGDIIETTALLEAYKSNIISDIILDVWENEPNINLELLKKCMIGTPHIAGYSADGKAKATLMSLEALCSHFNIKHTFFIKPPLPKTTTIIAPTINDALITIYDPREESNQLKAHPEEFEYLRNNYPLRREQNAYNIKLIS